MVPTHVESSPPLGLCNREHSCYDVLPLHLWGESGSAGNEAFVEKKPRCQAKTGIKCRVRGIAPMSENNAIVAVYDTHQSAENAVYELQKASFDIAKLSVAGKDYRAAQHAVGYYLVPGVGPVLVAGPLAEYVVKAVKAAVIVDGLGAIGCGLSSIGIPKNSVLKYESALKAGRFLLIAQGTRDELRQARQVIQTTTPAGIGVHVTDPPKTRTAGRFLP